MKLAVLGAGSWGLTLTWLLTNNFDEISLWDRNSNIAESINQNREITIPVKVTLDKKVKATSDIKEAIKDAQIVLLVVSTSGVREVCKKLRDNGIDSNQIVVNTSKGLELPSLLRMSEIINQELPHNEAVVLSGPTLAKEVLNGLPTAAVAAHSNIKTADFVQSKLNVSGKFRIYTNTDVIGVELGGSLKNVIAIAAGFVNAMKLGDNAKGAVLTRGLAEIVRVSVELGANPSTLYGLSGIGDLIATCSSPLSRNYQVGYQLGQGKKLNDILETLGVVAEGVKTSKAIYELSKKLNIEVPVSEIIYKAVYTDIPPKEVIESLMNRQLKSEDSYQFLLN